VVLKLEGRLIGPWVDELRKTVLRLSQGSRPLEIDVSNLTFADDDGEKALCWLHEMGVHFEGKSSYSDFVFEDSNVPPSSQQTRIRRKRQR